jgi:hypothetical protein
VMLTLWENKDSKQYKMKACTDDDTDRLNGYTFWGSHPQIDLLYKDNKYTGWAGGFSPTDLICTASHNCSGKAAGLSAQFKVEPNWGVGNRFVLGTIDTRRLKIHRNDKVFEARIKCAGFMNLHNRGGGNWLGLAHFEIDNKERKFHAYLQSDGALRDLPDDAMATILLAAPLWRLDHGKCIQDKDPDHNGDDDHDHCTRGDDDDDGHHGRCNSGDHDGYHRNNSGHGHDGDDNRCDRDDD